MSVLGFVYFQKYTNPMISVAVYFAVMAYYHILEMKEITT
jgi:hypothetical protein